MKILALDQSTKLTGWAVYQNGKCKKSGAIDLSSNENPAERMIQMCEAVAKIIAKTKPEFLVMEGVAYQRNAAALIELAQLQGVIIGTCLNNQIEFYIYPPSSWRKALGFKQGAGVKRADLKQQAMDYARELTGRDEPEDVAEAICIGAAMTKMIIKENQDG